MVPPKFHIAVLNPVTSVYVFFYVVRKTGSRTTVRIVFGIVPSPRYFLSSPTRLLLPFSAIGVIIATGSLFVKGVRAMIDVFPFLFRIEVGIEASAVLLLVHLFILGDLDAPVDSFVFLEV